MAQGADTGTKIRTAGSRQGRFFGLSGRVGDSEQSPEAMSLFTITVTVVSERVS